MDKCFPERCDFEPCPVLYCTLLCTVLYNQSLVNAQCSHSCALYFTNLAKTEPCLSTPHRNVYIRVIGGHLESVMAPHSVDRWQIKHQMTLWESNLSLLTNVESNFLLKSENLRRCRLDLCMERHGFLIN